MRINQVVCACWVALPSCTVTAPTGKAVRRAEPHSRVSGKAVGACVGVCVLCVCSEGITVCALACDLLPPWRSSSACRARAARGALVPWPASTQQSIDTSVLECCVARGHAASACGLMLKTHQRDKPAWERCGIVWVRLHMR